MDDFKKPTKMQCFKEGGSVKYESRKEHAEELKSDINQDKAIVKKAIKMHDVQEHKGEKTDLSKLKKGGRAKKAAGTVKKYKTGGTVENQYAAKKTSKDIADIANTKRQKPQMLCGGKSVKKYADGGDVSNPQALVDKIARQENADDASLLPRTARRIGRGIKRGVQSLGDMIGGTSTPPAPVPNPMQGQGAISNVERAAMPAMKKGGKTKGKC